MALIEKPLETGRWIEHGPLSIRYEREPNELYAVELYGEFDLNSAEVVSDLLARLADTDVMEIIIDLSGLEFVDSSGLAVLCEYYKRELEGANRLVLLRGGGAVERVLDLTGLHDYLPFAD